MLGRVSTLDSEQTILVGVLGDDGGLREVECLRDVLGGELVGGLAHERLEATPASQLLVGIELGVEGVHRLDPQASLHIFFCGFHE